MCLDLKFSLWGVWLPLGWKGLGAAAISVAAIGWEKSCEVHYCSWRWGAASRAFLKGISSFYVS